MKTKLAIRNIITLILFVVSVLYAEAETSVIVTLRNGNESTFNVEDNGGVYFSDNTISIKTTEETDFSYNLSEIQKLRFSYEGTDVESIASKEKKISIFPNPSFDFISITGIENLKIGIYSPNGSLLIEKEYSSGEKIDIRNLEKGSYIIKINNQALKFSKL